MMTLEWNKRSCISFFFLVLLLFIIEVKFELEKHVEN